MRFLTVSVRPSGVIPFIDTTHTEVAEYLPTVKKSRVRFSLLIFCLICATLDIRFSLNPALGPFITEEVGGSSTERATTFFALKVIAFPFPFKKRAGLPSSRSLTTSSKLSLTSVSDAERVSFKASKLNLPSSFFIGVRASLVTASLSVTESM